MSYRGDDLDLRTPRGWPSPEGQADDSGGGPIERYAPARRPIWVDETVLACCNDAFDVAAANGADEVALEHLLYAMTRVEAAAEVLESRGVRVFALRRETEAIVAGDAGKRDRADSSGPRRSDDLEDVLRRAAALAYRHGMSPSGDPASVDDIVDVLSDGRLDMSGLALFARHAGRSAREPSFRRAFALSSDYMSGPFARDRGRQSPAPYSQEPFVPPARRDALVEQGDAGRGGESAALVKVADRLQGLERALTEMKSGAGSQAGAMEKAVARVEKSLDSRSAEISAAWARIAERLKALEVALGAQSTPAALAPIDDRLAIIEEAVLGFDLQKHSSALAQLGGAFDDLGAKLDALPAGLDAVVDGKAPALTRAVTNAATSLGEKWGALLDQVGARQETRLAGVEAAVVGGLRVVEARQKTVANAIEAYGKANGECLDHIDARLMRLESANSRSVALIEDMHRLAHENGHWRRRFWRWLFGTNDWMAASWPAQSARVDAEIEGRTAR